MKWQCRSGPMVVLLVALVVVGTSVANAVAFGTDITTWDLRPVQPTDPDGQGTFFGEDARETDTNPLNPNISNYTQEDQETEPGTLSGQQWDLEAMYLNNAILSMVGGYNFANGPDNWESGDIFLSVNTAAPPALNDGGAGWQYVIDITNTSGSAPNSSSGILSASYTIYRLAVGASEGSGDIWGSASSQIEQSSPWRVNNSVYAPGGLSEVASGTLSVGTVGGGDTGDTLAGLNGGTRYYVSGIDLAPIFADYDANPWVPNDTAASFYAHYTYYCGNDVLLGQASVPGDITVLPEPASMVVVGLGLGLLGFTARKKRQS